MRNKNIPAQNVIKAWVQFNVVFVNVIIQVFCAQNLCDPNKLKREKHTIHNSLNQTKTNSSYSKDEGPDHSCHVHGKTVPS